MCIKTVTDDIVSVSDAAQYDAKNATIKIEPVQDLHGYDSPWPTGSGVNILDPKIKYVAGNYYGMTCSTNDGYTFSLSGTATSTGNLITSAGDNIILPAGTYTSIGATFSTYKSDGTWYTNRRQGVWTADEPFYVRSAYIEIISGRTYSETRFIALAKGSIDITSWTPYSNICPISGWDRVNGWNDPKYGGTIKWNQLFPNPENWEAHSIQTQLTLDDGVVTATLISGSPSVYAPAISLQGGTIITTVADHKYFVSCQFKPATNGTPYLRNNTAFASSFAFGNIVTPAGTWGDYANIISATSTGGAAWYIGQAGETSSISVGDSISIKNMMCIDLTEMFGEGNEPTTVETFKALFPHDYYSYDESYTETCVSAVNGDTYLHYTIPLGQTVYGGTLDVTKGELVVDRIVERPTSVSGSQIDTYGRCFIYTTGRVTLMKEANALVMCDMLASTIETSATFAVNQFGGVSSIYFISLDSTYDTITKYNAWLAENKPTIVLWLAEPITYQLTPQQIALLRGNNNVWADTGDTTLKYFTTAFEDLAEEIGFAEGGDY
jgi:hypothetical protein